mmetsp:Transcript_64582/g.154314  ORF Transcript_64582/g.154314 Transcript_64582/m.154314 type:complete len:233 (+) Transcript_64582:65-763(+)
MDVGGERPLSPSTPLSTDAAHDAEAAGKWYVWHGKILAVGRGSRKVYIGPHWYFSLLMLGFIEFTGYSYMTTFAPGGTGTSHFVGSVVITVLSTISFLSCALADPGISLPRPLPPQDSATLEVGGSSNDEEMKPISETEAVSPGRRSVDSVRQCSHCRAPQPRGTHHCHMCGVCILGWDHHCPWMGKCIGRDSICKFYSFIVIGFSSLGYMLLASILETPAPPVPTSTAIPP